MTVSIIFLLFGVITFLVDGCSAQKLNFPYGLTYHEKQNYVSNWSTDGTVHLSNADLLMFEPKLDVQMCSTMCTIDLSKCSTTVDEQRSPNTCYCTQKSGDEVNVHIGSLAQPAHSGLIVQAVLPSKEFFQPLAATRMIGKLPSIAESIVLFHKVPIQVQIGLTETMILRCEVKRQNGYPQSVTSLVIVRNGDEKIAEVNDTGDVNSFTDLSNVKVKGMISKNIDELASIELTWRHPTDKQIGMYDCKVDAIDTNGDMIKLYSSLVAGTSLKVVKRIQDNDNEKKTMKITLEQTTKTMKAMKNTLETTKQTMKTATDEMKQELESVKKTTKTELDETKKLVNDKETTMQTMKLNLEDANQKMKIVLDKMGNRIGKLESDKTTTKTELNEMKKSSKKELEGLEKLKSQDVKMLKDITSLKSQIASTSAPRHVESGKGSCSHSISWPKSNILYLGNTNLTGHNPRLRTLTFKFKKPYIQPPFVITSIEWVDTKHDANTRYVVRIDTIDRYGFTVQCQTWYDSIVYGLNFSWLSVASHE